MDMRKIAVACFTGGFLLGAAAFIFAPTFWWLGFFAGMAGGYLSYEFRDVLRAIPRAWRMVCRVNWRREGKEMMAMMAVATSLFPMIVPLASGGELLAPLVSAGAALMVTILMAMLGCVGMFRAFSCVPEDAPISVFAKEINLFTVLVYHIPWVLWRTVSGLAKGLALVLISLARIIKLLFVLIHSKERILCAFDGTLGGAAAWLWLAPSAETLAAKALVVLSCGLLGAAFGVLHAFLARRFGLVPSC